MLCLIDHIKKINEASLKSQQTLQSELKEANCDITVNPEIICLDEALMTAANKPGHAAIIEPLYEAGANVDCVKLNETPLFNAVMKGNLVTVKELIRLKAKTNHNDGHHSYGITLLILATLKGHKEVVEFLLKQVVDPNHTYQKSADGNDYLETACHFAEMHNHPDITALLRQHKEISARMFKEKTSKRGVFAQGLQFDNDNEPAAKFQRPNRAVEVVLGYRKKTL